MERTLKDPVRLPCGLTFPNRIVKAAMAEAMSKSGAPHPKFEVAYKNWGTGGWGAIFTGNIQVDERHRGSPGDVTVHNPEQQKKVEDLWRKYAAACKVEGIPTLAQINHPGRQSPRGAGNRGLLGSTIAPSSVPLNLGDNLVACVARYVAFGVPREMTVEDIHEVVQYFANSAKFLSDMGFSGVEIHSAHGYLLSQFLSSSSNKRTDRYGGSAAKRAQIVIEVIQEIRKVVPATFAVGIKLNSADHQHVENMKDALEQIKSIVDAGIDFMEISGGSYEDTRMFSDREQPKQSDRTSAREAFFLEFARVVRSKFPELILMVTGGFRTRTGMQAAISENACDLIGLGRPSVIYPHWPKDELLNDAVPEDKIKITLSPVPVDWVIRQLPIKVLGAGAESTYYAKQILQLGRGRTARPPGPSKETRL